MSRNHAVIFHRLRLEHRCHWEITDHLETVLQFIFGRIFLHYLLLYNILDNSRPELSRINSLSDYSLSVPADIHVLQHLLDSSHIKKIFDHPPPRSFLSNISYLFIYLFFCHLNIILVCFCSCGCEL